jgi:uncharacterized DUF497 family protein
MLSLQKRASNINKHGLSTNSIQFMYDAYSEWNVMNITNHILFFNLSDTNG